MNAPPVRRLVPTSPAALTVTPARLAQAIEEAERVFVTQGHDLFAAAILAEAQLRILAPFQGASFPDRASQQAWTTVQNTLREAQRAARAKPSYARGLDQYAARIETYERLVAEVEGDPAAHVLGREQRVLAIDAFTPGLLAVTLAALGMVLMLLSFQGGLLSVAAPVAALLAVASAVRLGWVRRARVQQRREARAELHAALVRAGDYARHMRDPEQGGWLASIWQSHPLLLLDAPSPVVPASGVFRVQRRRVRPAA